MEVRVVILRGTTKVICKSTTVLGVLGLVSVYREPRLLGYLLQVEQNLEGERTKRFRTGRGRVWTGSGRLWTGRRLSVGQSPITGYSLKFY